MNAVKKHLLVTSLEQSGAKESLLPEIEIFDPDQKFPQESGQILHTVPVHVVAGCAYCAASASMVVLNKAALSSFDFHCPTSLLFFQCLMCCVLSQICSALNLVRMEPWNLKIVQSWLPVNVLFVGMIWSSFLALKKLGVPMATVLKNLTNLFVILGDYTMYGKVYGGGVWASLALMCASAICGSLTDLAFDLEGYLWQLVNCIVTASYSLHLRGVMDHVVAHTMKNTPLDECSMVFYNNFLSLPLLFLLTWWSGELDLLMDDSALRNTTFILVACASAVVAFSISFASLWFLSTTTATSYSLVGSLNKIPVAIIGLVAFNVPWDTKNLASILVGLLAGIVFVKAKSS